MTTCGAQQVINDELITCDEDVDHVTKSPHSGVRAFDGEQPERISWIIPVHIDHDVLCLKSDLSAYATECDVCVDIQAVRTHHEGVVAERFEDEDGDYFFVDRAKDLFTRAHAIAIIKGETK